jgi:hypothetical protein
VFLNTCEQPRRHRSVIPLNGVSRVRIPPPLPKPPICKANAQMKEKPKPSPNPVDTTFDANATRKVFSRERSSLERHCAWVTVLHGGQRSRSAEIRYPQGMSAMIHPPLVLPRLQPNIDAPLLPPPPNTMMNRSSITRFGVFCTFPSHQNRMSPTTKSWT